MTEWHADKLLFIVYVQGCIPALEPSMMPLQNKI